MSDFKLNAQGQIVELAEVNVPEDFEDQLQAELDEKQNHLNEATATLDSAEQEHVAAEAHAEETFTALETARKEKEAAETALQKSIDRRDGYKQALELRANLPESEPASADGNGDDGSSTETTSVPVHDAEGNLVGAVAEG